VNDAGKLAAWCLYGGDRCGDLFGALRPTLNLEPGNDHRASFSPVSTGA
jgi:hypothetical protein